MHLLKSSFKLLKNGYVLAMVLGIFIYCGVEIAVSSHVPIFLNDKFMISVEKMGLLISWSLFYLPIFLGRFFGSFIMTLIAPKRLLLITGLVALTGLVIIFSKFIHYDIDRNSSCGIRICQYFSPYFFDYNR